MRGAVPALLTLCGRAPAGTRLVWAGAESGDYPVFVGAGLIASGFLHPPDGRRFVVTDENVAAPPPRGGRGADRDAGGGGAEDLRAAEAVLRAARPAGAARGDLVVAVGGGVVGDLAGFCAAVYQRGMRHVQVPTTLVAQVDSAYGGKTGVDLPEGKNYAGAYHQPAAVISDPAALETLPREELAAGYAEVVKTALIAGGPLWARVRQGEAPDDDVVARLPAHEAGGGRRRRARRRAPPGAEPRPHRRPRDRGGHRLRAATGTARPSAIGLLAALRLSGRDALREEVADLLARTRPAARRSTARASTRWSR